MRALASSSVTSDHDGNVSVRTPLILLWAFTTLIWSIFTVPEKTFAARVLQFQPTWLIRVLQHDSTWIQDLVLFQTLHTTYSYWTGAWQISNFVNSWFLDFRDRTTQLYLQIFSLLAICGLFAGGIVVRERHLRAQDRTDEPLHQQTIIEENVLPPLLIPSQTTHTRLIPKKHAFSYSYLLVGIPIGLRGRVNSMLSVETERQAWFHIDSADFLDRGSSQLSLAEKLKRYLHTQGVTDRDYAFAYLVTAPRFLGYTFNPVSFWYLYDSDTRLKYMILEVNNTFGERRMYLLRPDDAKHDSGVDIAAPAQSDPEDTTKKLVFAETWEKDFHVSPFNSRKGSYSLRATDPLAAYEETGHINIDSTIVLRSSKDSAKIVARVMSEGDPRDASTMSTVDKVKFILAWCWVGFATLPRIVWEAAKLSFKRKLHVWYRPEVTEQSVSRTYNDDEKTLEAFFRAFLTHATSSASKPLRVIYEPAHNPDTEIVLYSPGFTYEEAHKRTLTVKVLSPAFYSRFVHYAHTQEAFDRECLATDEMNRTVIVQPAELLPILLDAICEDYNAKLERRGPAVDQIRWSFLRRLRCSPASQAYLMPGSDAAPYNNMDFRNSHDSELDRFVQRYCEDRDIYRRTATKLFFAQRFALGTPALIVGMDWLIRSSMVLLSMVYSDHSNAVDILRPRPLKMTDAFSVAITLGLANAVHVWALLKG